MSSHATDLSVMDAKSSSSSMYWYANLLLPTYGLQFVICLHIEKLHHCWVPAVIIYIYAYLWLFGRHTGGAPDTLGVQRRQYNVIYFYSTLSTFAVLLRKCCPLSKLQLSDNILFKTFAKKYIWRTGQFVLNLCCYLLKCYNGYWLLFLFFSS